MRRVLWYIMVVAITLMALVLMWQLRIAIVFFALSLGIAAALRPWVRALVRRKFPRPVALGVVYAVTIGSILLFLWLVSGPLIQDVQKAADGLVTGYDRAKLDWPHNGSLFQRTLAEQLPPSAELYRYVTSADGMPALKGVVGVGQSLFGSLGSLAIVIVLSLYWSADQQRFEWLAVSLLPKEHHEKALDIWRSIESGVGDYLRSELLQSFLAGLTLWLGYALMGIPFPMLLALWGAIARLIPWFGALIAVLPAFAILIWGSPVLGLLAVLYTVSVIMGLRLLVEPRLVQRQQPYSALVIVLFVIALAELVGFIGVILAPPLAVAMQILFLQLYPFPTRRFSEQTLQKAVEIRNRLQDVRRLTRAPADERNVVLVRRLRRLLSRAIDYIQEY